MARAASDLRTITGLDDWSKLDLDAISRFRSVRLAGGWQRKNRTVRPADPRTVNGDLRALRAFLSRAVTKGWVTDNILKGAADEWVKVKSIRVNYMPDCDLRTLIDSAGEPWLRTFIVIAYYTGARRSDLLRLEWDTDIDLTGEKIGAEDGTGPHIFIRGSKADTPRWAPLHPCAVQALEALRREPIDDRNVFPMRESRNPASFVSHRFARLCREAGLKRGIVQDGKDVTKARWTLHSLRRKSNTDLRDRGASPKERVELLGQRTTAVNEKHYEAIRPDRARALIDALPTFEMVG